MSELTYECHVGPAILPFVPEMAEFRIRGFRAFPYLYEGTTAYEEKYLQGYVHEPRALLVRVLDGRHVIGVATATPLASSADIVAEAPLGFAAAGHDPKTFYYYAEILVTPSYRGRGIARRVYEERERHARQWGYRHLCLAVVERPEDHPLKPNDYAPPERIWIRDGFERTGIRFAYEWPTIQPGGLVVAQQNPMVFWMKELR